MDYFFMFVIFANHTQFVRLFSKMRVHKLKLGALNHGPKRTTRKNLDGGLGDEDP